MGVAGDSWEVLAVMGQGPPHIYAAQLLDQLGFSMLPYSSSLFLGKQNACLGLSMSSSQR